MSKQDKRKGITRHKDKPLANTRANQWTGNPQQILCMTYYLDVNSPDTFSNMYKSALKAGYEDTYARKLSAPSNYANWISEYVYTGNLELKHLEGMLSDIIVNRDNVQSKSVDDTRLKAIELVAKLKGYMIERKQVQSVVKVELGKVNAPIEQVD